MRPYTGRVIGVRQRWLSLPLVLLLAACGGDREFEAAERGNSVAGWDAYLRAHPDGRHAAEARARIVQLREPDDWRKAHALDTVAGYQQYLSDHADGAHAHDALVAIASLNLGSAPVVAPAAAAAPAAGPAAPSPSPASAAARAPAAATPAKPERDFRVQLGAYSGSEAAASEAWGRLLAQHSELKGRVPLISAGRTGDGRPIQRLQVGGLDRSAAESLCQRLNANGAPCVIVRADAISGH